MTSGVISVKMMIDGADMVNSGLKCLKLCRRENLEKNMRLLLMLVLSQNTWQVVSVTR
jgi:hypothetical protein